MKKSFIRTALILALVLTLCLGPVSLGFSAGAASRGTWLTTWGSSLVNGSISLGSANFSDIILAGSTIRTEVPVTTDGRKLIFTFSNQYGNKPITINEASVARTKGNGRANIVDGTQLPITFNDGDASVTIQPGEKVESDDIIMDTKALEYISVSLYFENLTYMSSVGLSNGRTFMKRSLLDGSSQVNSTYFVGANEVNISSGTITYHTIPFLEKIESLSSSPDGCTAVFIGDSTLVNNAYLHYAKRIISAGRSDIGIVNEAVIGNKLLSDGSGIIGNLYGQAMLDRFARDVLDLSAVKYCFVKIGLNDILHQFSKTISATTPKHSAEDIIAGYRTLINRCHERGIKIYFFTKSAWNGYERNFLGSGVDIEWTKQEQDMCDKLTKWVLENKEADGYIDCSPLADPSDPTKLCSTLTLDGAHLSELGAVALADLIPLQYVGVGNSGKTAAQIAGVNPYKEKNEILANMKANETTTKAPETTTAAPETTTAAPETTTLPPATTQPDNSPPPYTVFEQESEEQTVAYEIPGVDTNATEASPPAAPVNQDVNYVVTDDNSDTRSSIGNGSSIGFIMAFVLVGVVALTMAALTLFKKKEV